MKSKAIVAIVLVICLFIFLLPARFKSALPSTDQDTIEQVLSHLSTEEQYQLKKLFDHLFFFDQCAYPLFGTKPMSIGPIPNTPEACAGLAAWEKLASSLHSSTFLVRTFTHNNRQFLLTANLPEIDRLCQTHLDLFSDPFTPQALHTCLSTEGPLFHDLLNNDLLLGILLGYGRHNATLFTRNQTLPLTQQFPLASFSHHHPLFYFYSPVMPIYFACDPDSPETQSLQAKYRTERKTILQLAKRNNLFFLMLLALAKH